MPQAKISVNAVVGSNTDVPLNNVVQLDNVNIGGELTYNWTILDQPPGATDALSSNVVQNPSFTPRKEGSYYIKLIVNLGLATEQEDRVIVAVRQIKTRERIPAAGETTETDSSDGWATAMNSLLRRIDTLLSDSAIMVGKNDSGGVLTKGQIVRCTSLPTIKTGLPGQEVVPGFILATAATLGQVDELLAIVEGGPDGSVTVADQGVLKVRHFGVPRNADGTAQTFAGSPTVGDPVYLSDTGVLALAAGTVRRQLAAVASVGGGSYSVMFNGVGGADITPIDRRYVVHGPAGTLSDAVRVDGANATGVTTPFRVKAGDAGTVPFQVQGFAAGADLQQWLSSTSTVVARITNAGQLTLDAEGLSIPTTGKHITFGNAAQLIRWPSTSLREAATDVLGFYDASGANLSVQFSRTATFGAVTAFAPPSPGQTQAVVLAADSTAGLVRVGNQFSAPLDFITGNTARWRVASAGELQAQGGNRAIQNVLDPVNVQDATTKVYVDNEWRAGGHPNYVINGHFRYWQRTGGGTLSGAGSRFYNADRWQFIRATASGNSVDYSRETGPDGARYAGRITRANGDSTTTAGLLWQEIDRELVRGIQGRKMRCTFKARKGAGYSATSDLMGVELFSGTSETEVLGDAGYATGNSSLGSGTVQLTTSWQKFTRDFTAVPTTATALGLRFLALWTGTAGANDYIEISDVHFYPVDNANPTLLSQGTGFADTVGWEPHGGSEQAEIEACQRHYCKSYELDTAVGTNTANGAWRTNFITGTGSNGVAWDIGFMPRFPVPMFRAPTIVTVYGKDGTINQWTFAGTNTASASAAITTLGFDVISQIVGGVTADYAQGHWEATAEL